MLRQKIYALQKKAGPLEQSPQNRIYHLVMTTAICISLIPLAFKEDRAFFSLIDRVTAALFITDYLLRWITADLSRPLRPLCFLTYPLSPMALIDLFSILPTFLGADSALKLLRLFRLTRSIRVLKIMKALRFSKSFSLITKVFRDSRSSLMAAGTLAGEYILVSALIVFNVEPDSFDSFFEAVYWATVSLTTVGYGDIYPQSTPGRIITMVSSLFGIAIVALPAGIITAGYMAEITKPAGPGPKEDSGPGQGHD